MRTIPAALQAHLDSGATTMCFCWRVTRTDGIKQGFTDHDEDLTFDGTTFSAGSGFTASQISKTLGLSVDNLEVSGALSADTINEDDLAAGRYDDAYVELFWVNWKDPSQRVLQTNGFTGEAKRMGVAFQAELRGLTSRLNQATNRTFQRTCDATVGDSRCKFNFSSRPGYRSTGTVQSALSPRAFYATGQEGVEARFYNQGVLRFTGGKNAGVRLDVKSHTVDGDGRVLFELWGAPAFVPVLGDTFEVTAGCDQSAGTCKAKFDNIANFRGFNRVPGPDAVIRNVDPAASNTGSSNTTTTQSK